MGSYTPPAPAAVTSAIKEFTFEQVAELIVNKIETDPHVLKTITISNIPLDDAGNPMGISIVHEFVDALGKRTAGAGSVFLGWSEKQVGGNPSLIFGISTVSATFAAMKSASGSTDIANPGANNTSVQILLVAMVTTGTTTGVLKNFKETIQMRIPKGATVVES